jgi:hypothetical protein
MDVSRMSGANPAAANVVVGTATATWTMALIHPTTPVIKINVTVPGTITTLQMLGKTFQNSNTPYVVNVKDSQSIALYGQRILPIQNDFIINSSIASSIAARLLLLYKSPTNYLKQLPIRPTFSMQLGDRVNVVDENSDLSDDYNIAGIRQTFSNEGSLDVKTVAVLVKI